MMPAGHDADTFRRRVWDACVAHSRPAIDQLAQHMTLTGRAMSHKDAQEAATEIAKTWNLKKDDVIAAMRGDADAVIAGLPAGP